MRKTTIKHENGTEWIFHQLGVDGNEKQRFGWTCVDSQRTEFHEYLCDKHGWISIDTPPKIIGTFAIVANAKSREMYMDSYGEDDELQWEGATHWMPEPEMPEVKP